MPCCVHSGSLFSLGWPLASLVPGLQDTFRFGGALAALGACFWCPCGTPSLPLHIGTLSFPLHDLWLSHLLARIPLSVEECMVPKLETSKSIPGRFFEPRLSGCLKLLLSLATVQSLHWDLFAFHEIFVCLPLCPNGLILWQAESVSDYLATSLATIIFCISSSCLCGHAFVSPSRTEEVRAARSAAPNF